MLVLNFHDGSDELTRTKSKRNANSQIIIMKKKINANSKREKKIHNTCRICEEEKSTNETFLLPDRFVWHVHGIYSLLIYSLSLLIVCVTYSMLSALRHGSTHMTVLTSQPTLSLACGMLCIAISAQLYRSLSVIPSICVSVALSIDFAIGVSDNGVS